MSRCLQELSLGGNEYLTPPSPAVCSLDQSEQIICQGEFTLGFTLIT